MKNFSIGFTDNGVKRYVDVNVNIIDENRTFTIMNIECVENDIFNSHFGFKVGDVVDYNQIIAHFVKDTFYEDVLLYDCGNSVEDLQIDLIRRDLGKVVDLLISCIIDDISKDPTYTYTYNTSDQRIKKDYLLNSGETSVGTFAVDKTLGGVSVNPDAGESLIEYDAEYQILMSESDEHPWIVNPIYCIGNIMVESETNYIGIDTNKVAITGDLTKATVRNMDASFVDGNTGLLSNAGDGIYVVGITDDWDLDNNHIVQLCLESGYVMLIMVDKKK